MNDKTQREDLTKIDQSTISGLFLKSFQDYKIVKELPAGGAEADNFLIQKNQQQFFLKLYRKGINPNINVLKNLKKLTKKLKEHVVEIYDVGYDEELQRFYEIMEYVPYGDLRALIKEIQNLPDDKKEKQIKSIIKEIAEALNFLHENGIIHRDLKPSNILIRNKEPLDLVFIDFGISKELNEELSKVATSSFKGTIYYIAPEEISNYFGKEIDWWHFGIIIYELFTGKNPFAKLSEHSVINLLTTKGIEIPKTIPEIYQVLLKGLLTRDYEKRWGYNQIQDWLQGKKKIPVYYEDTENQDNKWDELGIPKNSPWRNLDGSPEEILSFKEADFGVSEAKKWLNAGWKNAKIARNWFNNGFEAEEAYLFENFGLSIKQAKSLVAKGITAFDLDKTKNKIEHFEEFLNEILTLIKEGYNPSPVVLRYHQWKETGLNLRNATYWANEGFEPNEVQDWIKHGFNLQKARIWKQFGFDTQESLEWEKTNISPQKAKKYKQDGFNAEEVKILKEQNLNYSEAKEWKSFGFNLSEVTKWKELGFSIQNANDWKNAGFNAYEAKLYLSKKVPLYEAKEWKYSKFNTEDALKWYSRGASLKIAEKWTNAGLRPKHFSGFLISMISFYLIEFIIFLYFFFTFLSKR